MADERIEQFRGWSEYISSQFELCYPPEVGDDVTGPGGMQGKVTAVDGSLVTMTFPVTAPRAGKSTDA